MHRFRWAATAALFVALILLPSGTAATSGDALPDLSIGKPTEVYITHPLDGTGRRLLFYTATVSNLGTGSFELDASRPDAATPFTTVQRIFDTAGGSRTVPTGVQMEWAAGTDFHNHWHVVALETGTLTGYAKGSPTVGTVAKHGFCFEDVDTVGPYNAGSAHQGFFTYSAGSVCGYANPDALSFRDGLTYGYLDYYYWDFPFQYIDITGLPSGRYSLTVTVNTGLGIVESSYANDTATVTVNVHDSDDQKHPDCNPVHRDNQVDTCPPWVP